MRKIYLSAFELLYLCFMSVIFFFAVTGTYSHIAWYKVLFLSFMWGIFLFCTFLILNKANLFLSKHKTLILLFVSIIYFILLFSVSLISANTPNIDYGQVYNASQDILFGREVEWEYFARFKNNYALFLIMIAISYPGYLLGINGLYCIIFVSALSVIATAIIIFKILEYYKQPYSICFFSLILFASFLPIWGGTQYFYTDQATYC